MKRILKKLRPGPPPIDKIWLANQLKEIKVLAAATLAEVKDSERKKISPELEAQVNRAWAMARKIDQKVPDKTVPPGSTTPTKRKDT